VVRRVFALVLLAFLAGFAMPAGAAVPEGPRLAISVSDNEGSEVITTGPSGEDPQKLVGGKGVLIGGSLSWSAGGQRLAFSVPGARSTASGPYGTGWPVVGVTDVEGGASRSFPRAFLNAGEQVMAPNGRSVVFQRLKLVKASPDGESHLFKSSIWSLDAESGSVRRLTRWRLASFLEPISFSPDGSALVAVLYGRRGIRVVAVDLRSHRTRPLALLGRDDFEPTYSPDGSRLAFVRVKYLHSSEPLPARPVSELLVARADGSDARRLLRRKGYISSPRWDPSGSRLAFTHDPPEEATGVQEPEPGNEAWAINADGTCLTRVFTNPEMTLFEVAWRPGPGREAGPISC
jgi:Tol biopolymer transport system component